VDCMIWGRHKTLWEPLSLWRGSLLPLGCAAVANPFNAICVVKLHRLKAGPLRSLARASSLATGGLGQARVMFTTQITVGAGLPAMAALQPT